MNLRFTSIQLSVPSYPNVLAPYRIVAIIRPLTELGYHSQDIISGKRKTFPRPGRRWGDFISA